MATKKQTRAQTSLEYLITYGWALVVIATIIVVFIFATGGSINANTCSTFLTMICKGIGADGDTLVLILQNTTGQKITINPYFDISFDEKTGYAIITYQGDDYQFEDVSIGAGNQFTISAKGMAEATEVSITYYEESTGLTKTVTSNLKTDVPDDIEISNDGIDNDGDGLIDCDDPDVTDCEYITEADAGYPTAINNVFQAIPFSQVKGVEGADLPGDWQIQAGDIVALSFYVENFVAGTTADVRFWGTTETVTLVDGWNVTEIIVPGGAPVSAVSMPDFEIRSNGPEFTISATETPTAFLILNIA